jgi:hypothetical protein
MTILGPQSLVNCPRCNQPVSIQLEQILDVTVDKDVKQRLLSGSINIIDCPLCSFHGMAPTPVIYHDQEKELLLTYTPAELNIPLSEKEKLFGTLTRTIVNGIPSDKRKAYLLQPKEMFSIEGLKTTILNSDGITNEMIEQQRSKMDLLQTLISTPQEMLPDLIKERDEELDDLFFQLLSALKQSQPSTNTDSQSSILDELEDQLLSHSTFGKRSQEYAAALQKAAGDLESIGAKLTRQNFLDLILKAPDDIHITCLVTLARPAADYEFFILLTNQLETSPTEDQPRLEHIRSLILETVQKIDEVSQQKTEDAQAILASIIDSNNPKETIEEHIKDIDQSIMVLLQQHIENAQSGDNKDEENRLLQLQNWLIEALHQHAPPSLRFINELLSLNTQEEVIAMIKNQIKELDKDILDIMQSVADQLQSDQQTELATKLQDYIPLVRIELETL